MSASLERLLNARPVVAQPDRQLRAGIGMGWLAMGMLVSAIAGALGGRLLAVQTLAPELAQSSRIAVIDVPSVALSAVRPGDPEAGREHVNALIARLVSQGYVVIPVGSVLGAPEHVQVQ